MLILTALLFAVPFPLVNNTETATTKTDGSWKSFAKGVGATVATAIGAHYVFNTIRRLNFNSLPAETKNLILDHEKDIGKSIQEIRKLLSHK